MNDTDLAIVGAGPAGMVAAAEAAALGLTVTLLDDNARPGGQYFRQPPLSFRHTGQMFLDKDRSRGAALAQALDHPSITHWQDAVVWDMPEPGVLAVAAGERSGRVYAKAVLIATGAQDRPVPFPGWTLPGVISAGGLQNLLKGQRVVPGKRAVVVGNGPLLLLIGANLVRAGVEVAAVVEAAPIRSRVVSALPMLARAPDMLALAIRYRAVLARAGVPVLTGWTATAATGMDVVSSCRVAPIDAEGRIDRASERSFDCDLLVTGFGLMPSLELPRLLGADLAYDRRRGGWTVTRDADFQCSVRHVYVAGDGAGIGGAEMALLEGRIAARAIARKLGKTAPDDASLRSGWARRDAFRRGLEAIYAPPASFLDLLTDDTVICRCEDVTVGDIARRRGELAGSVTQIKATTRLSMGRCQGRNCLVTLASMVAQQTGVDVSTIAPPRPRPPLRTIPIGDLAFEDIPPPDIPADPHLPRKQRV